MVTALVVVLRKKIKKIEMSATVFFNKQTNPNQTDLLHPPSIVPNPRLLHARNHVS